MTCAVNEQIRQYEMSKERLEDLLSSDTEYTSDEISKADADVVSAFDALLALNTKSSLESKTKVQFLITEIRNNLVAGSLTDRMANAVENELLKMSDSKF